jgi:hypothetical protein
MITDNRQLTTDTTDTTTLAAILRETRGCAPFPTRNERAAWDALRDQSVSHQIVEQAEHALREPTPVITASKYLAYFCDGERESYGIPADRRRERLALMTLAECLEARGRFLDAILDEAWAVCEQSTWVIPAHARDYPNQLADPAIPLIDLFSAITAFTLAETDYLLGDALHPAVRVRIRHEVARRSTEAFLARDDYPWLGKHGEHIHNWLPVCAGAAACAALYLEADIERLAVVLAKAIDGMQRYLGSFGADGACVEGVGYWETGFSYFTAFAHLLYERTAGRIDLFDNPHAKRIAAFPAQVALSPGQFVTFSDMNLGRRPQPALLHFLARRYDLPALAALDNDSPHQRTLTRRHPPEKLRDLFWYPVDVQPTYVTPALSAYLPDAQWLIARAMPSDPDGLVLAAKGGHNDEPHNHNDVGSFIVHWRGESLIADLGAGRYVRDYFDDQQRYTFLQTRSRGHSVPLVNECEQQAGAAFRATDIRHIVQTNSDTVEMHLGHAYPASADLSCLRRRITLYRSGEHGYVELSDQVAFRALSGMFESTLISFAPASEPQPGMIVVHGARGALIITYNVEQLQARIERISGVAFKRSAAQHVTRISVRLRHLVGGAKVTLRLTPLL